MYRAAVKASEPTIVLELGAGPGGSGKGSGRPKPDKKGKGGGKEGGIPGKEEPKKEEPGEARKEGKEQCRC